MQGPQGQRFRVSVQVPGSRIRDPPPRPTFPPLSSCSSHPPLPRLLFLLPILVLILVLIFLSSSPSSPPHPPFQTRTQSQGGGPCPGKELKKTRTWSRTRSRTWSRAEAGLRLGLVLGLPITSVPGRKARGAFDMWRSPDQALPIPEWMCASAVHKSAFFTSACFDTEHTCPQYIP